jgi:hypothetical protein
MLREPKSFPRPEAEMTPAERKRRERKRFSGYAAEHYRVRLRDSDLSTDEKKYSDGRCEIQVASVLMHAWAEVEHDLEYKTLLGSVSASESHILDQINGLVIAGEMALEQLQDATKKRVSTTNDGDDGGGGGVGFRDQYDLANWLLNIAERANINPRPVVGRADLAFRLIELAKVSSSELARFQKRVNIISEGQTLAQKLIEFLLSENQRRDALLQRARIDVAAVESATAPAAMTSPSVEVIALGQFLTKWREIESIVRRKANPTSEQKNSLNEAINLLETSDDVKGELHALRRLRNEVIHSPSENTTTDRLFTASERLERIGQVLEYSQSDVVSRAMRRNEFTLKKLASIGIEVGVGSAFWLVEDRSIFSFIRINNATGKSSALVRAALDIDGFLVSPSRSGRGIGVGSSVTLVDDDRTLPLDAGADRGILFGFSDLDTEKLALSDGKMVRLRISIADAGDFSLEMELSAIRND